MVVCDGAGRWRRSRFGDDAAIEGGLGDGASYPTATQTRYDNSGSVKILQETTPVSSFAVRSTGGGTGEGIRVVSVGDFVWLDADHDGIQDAGEAGIPGVTLKLTGPGGAPIVDVDGMPVLPVKTDANGAYHFANLPAIPAGSSYTVTVDTAASAAALTGLFPTLTGQGTTATDSSTGFAASAADLSAAITAGAMDPGDARVSVD